MIVFSLQIKQLIYTLSLFRSECYELDELSSNDTLLVICALSIQHGLWHRFRWSETQAKILQHCPHILHHDVTKDQFSLLSSFSLDTALSALQCEALLLLRNKLNNKLKKLKSLKQTKETLQTRLQSQLSEIRPSEITALSPKLMKNVVNGLDLNSPAATLSEEMHRFHDILADLEQDYKDEELFWRWIVGTDIQRSTNIDSRQQINSVINSARAEVEGRILDLIKSKSFSDVSQLQQLYTEANEGVKLAFSPLIEQVAEDGNGIDNSENIDTTKASEEVSLQVVLNDLLMKTNLVSPIIATLNNNNNTKS